LIKSKPALRKPDNAARVVCGCQPNFALIALASAPDFRDNNLMSWFFLDGPLACSGRFVTATTEQSPKIRATPANTFRACGHYRFCGA
jgi:hypothetical protein